MVNRQTQQCRTGSQQQAAAHQSGDEPDDYGSQTDTPGETTRPTRDKALFSPDPIPGNSNINTGALDQSIEAGLDEATTTGNDTESVR